MPVIQRVSPVLDGSAVSLGSAAPRTIVIPSGEYATPLWIRDGGAVVHRVDALPWRGRLVGDTIEALSAAPGGGVSPLLTIGWDGYANTAALLADPNVFDSSGTSGAVTLETVTGQAFTKAVRSTFLAANTYADHTIGVTVTIPNAATHFLREMWFEYLVRFGGPYEGDGPISNGGPGEKHLFIFDQEETGAGRWEFYLNIGDANMQTLWGGKYSFETSGGSGGAPVAYSPNMAALYENPSWNVVRGHARMHASTGMWRVQVNGQNCPWGNVGNTDRGSHLYFEKFALQRNINRGVYRDQWRETGPIAIYDQDPGWTWS